MPARRAALLVLLLAAAGPAADPARPDANGDPLPDGAVARLGNARVPSGQIVVLPPDYASYVVTTPTGAAVRRDLATGKVLGPTGTGTIVSADGKRAVGANTGPLTVTDVATGKAVASVKTPGSTTAGASFGYPSVALSGDGKRLAQAKWGFGGTGKDGVEVFVWDVDANKQVAVVKAVQTQTVTPVLSVDGSTLATWGASAFVPSAPSTTAAPVVEPKAPRPDGNRTVQVWDAATGKELAKVEAAGQRPQSVALSADGALVAAGCGDGRVEVWDARTGAVRAALLGRTGQGVRVAFSPDGTTVAAVGTDGTVQRWKLDGTPVDTIECPAPPGTVAVLGVGFAGPDRVVAWGTVGAVAVAWDAPAGKLLTPLGDHHGGVASIAFADGGKAVVTSGADGRVVRWDAAGGKATGVVELRRGRTGSFPNRAALTLGPGGKWGFGRYPFAVYDAATGSEEFALPPDRQNRGVTGAFVSPDGTRVAVASTGPPFKTTGYAVWDLANRRKLFELEAPGGGGGFGTRAAFSPDNARLVTVTDAPDADGRRAVVVTGWDGKTGRRLAEFAEPAWSAALQLAVADSTSGVVVTNTGEVFAFDHARGVAGDRVGERVGNVGAVAFSPDRTRLVIATGPTVRVYGWPRGDALQTFSGHTGSVTALAFGPDGKTLATGADDTTVLLWDLNYRAGNTK